MVVENRHPSRVCVTTCLVNYFLAEALDIWRDGVSQLSLTNYLDVRLDQRLESVG